MRAEELLQLFDFPRDNGSAGLERGRALIDSLLTTVGVEARAHSYECVTLRTEVAAACILVSASLWIVAAWRQRRLFLYGTAAALLAALLVGSGALDALLPSVPQTNLHYLVQPQQEQLFEVLLSAHYDSKTEWLDHVERSIAAGACWLACAVGMFLNLRRRPGARPAAVVAAGTLVALALHWGGGRWLPRSHGMVDDAAACTLLVELAARASHRPLLHTRLRFVWFSGEEVGGQGSEALSWRLDATKPRLVLNLETIGAGPRLVYAAREWTGRSLAGPAAETVRQLTDAGLRDTLPFPVQTDAAAFLRRGTPAVTLLNTPRSASWIRGLHSKADCLPAVDLRGLEATRTFLLQLLLDMDS